MYTDRARDVLTIPVKVHAIFPFFFLFFFFFLSFLSFFLFSFFFFLLTELNALTHMSEEREVGSGVGVGSGCHTLLSPLHRKCPV